MKLRLVVLLLAASAVVGLAAVDTPCLDPKGNEVDWWVIYKLPSKYDQGLLGTEYYYYDSAGTEKKPDQQESINDDEESPLRITIKKADMSVLDSVMAYNDDYPKYKNSVHAQRTVDYQVNSDYAHAKGMVSLQKDSTTDKYSKGFWISHSFPHFPQVDHERNIRSDIGRGQLVEAQHALCLTLNTKEKIKAVLNHLKVMKVKTRVHNFQGAFPVAGPLLECEGRVHMAPSDEDDCKKGNMKLTDMPDVMKHIINPEKSSSKGQLLLEQDFTRDITLWAKSNLDQKQDTNAMEIWREIARKFKAKPSGKMIVQTYHNAKNHGDNEDVTQQQRHEFGDWGWTRGSDHSKWGFFDATGSERICFGDLNRHNNQPIRGGGVICFNNNKKLFENMEQFYVSSVKIDQDYTYCDPQEELDDGTKCKARADKVDELKEKEKLEAEANAIAKQAEKEKSKKEKGEKNKRATKTDRKDKEKAEKQKKAHKKKFFRL